MSADPDAPFLLGLTGSIGMGKSTAAGLFAEYGIPVWDADASVHGLYQKGGAAVARIADLAPQAVEDGAVNRVALADWIAADPSRLEQLEAIVHPLVAADRQDFISSATAPVVVLDIPLLFETGADNWLSAVAVVTTDAATQRARVLDRPGMTEERFELILSKQTPDSEKRAKADYLIPSDTLEGARQAINDILADIKGRQNA